MLWLQLEQEVTTAECPCALSLSFQLGEWEEQDRAQIVWKQVLSLAEIQNGMYGLAVRDYTDFWKDLLEIESVTVLKESIGLLSHWKNKEDPRMAADVQH